jgi:hypothetical protein
VWTSLAQRDLCPEPVDDMCLSLSKGALRRAPS